MRYPTTTDEERETAIEAATVALQRGDLAVLPTDTVYGIAADAFDADAVAELLAAKGRGREMPPPVLVGNATTIDALARDVPAWVRVLVEEFWPGPLTIVCHQQSSLLWDLGETRGTVAVRMPDHAITRAVLDRTGPLAVSSANVTGEPAATDADRAESMLGDRVAVVVDAGESPVGEASTIVDATRARGRILRRGALSLARLNAVLEPLGTSLLDVGAEEASGPSLEKTPDKTPDKTTDQTPGAGTDEG
ncbi:L-threonylcarbamoyladenylate synthase [Nocardioides sp. 1609]|uniref:L-threonylcarbamoyladenylate synthase n=1 Tax=Nocardioides sp. 1609 TaxID=2508327 RepID=UPI0032AEF350